MGKENNNPSNLFPIIAIILVTLIVALIFASITKMVLKNESSGEENTKDGHKDSANDANNHKSEIYDETELAHGNAINEKNEDTVSFLDI
jgi:hypothetical protein